MPTRHAAIFNEALEQGFCCVLTIRFIERSLFFEDGYTLALNGAITVCMISDILPHVTHRQMQFLDKLGFTWLHLTSQKFLHAAAIEITTQHSEMLKGTFRRSASWLDASFRARLASAASAWSPDAMTTS